MVKSKGSQVVVDSWLIRSQQEVNVGVFVIISILSYVTVCFKMFSD